MSLFHDEEDGPAEPVRGLPEKLPEGERILWQGSPRTLTLAIHAFHIRFVALYFVGMTAWRLAAKSSAGAPAAEMMGVVTTSLGLGIAAAALVFLIAWAFARSAIFTLTDKRIVMRYGAAIRKYVNLPYGRIASADVREHRGGSGDIALTMNGPGGPSYLHLWPFARPMKIARPKPLLRGLANVREVAAILATAVKAAAPDQVELADRPAAETAPAPAARPGVNTRPIGAT